MPLWHRLGGLAMPVLVVSGGDQKFSVLGGRMVETIGQNATLAVVPGTGHSPPPAHQGGWPTGPVPSGPGSAGWTR